MSIQSFHRSRVLGALAESVVRAHFEALGWRVAASGVEYVFPDFAALSATNLPDTFDFQHMRDTVSRLPDFLLTRIVPDTKRTADARTAGRRQAIFVEAKYRTVVEPNALAEELYVKYNNFISIGVPILAYVLTRDPPYVLTRLYSTEKFPVRHQSQWAAAGDKIFDKLPLYQGIDGRTFNSVYASVVQPALEEIWGPPVTQT